MWRAGGGGCQSPAVCAGFCEAFCRTPGGYYIAPGVCESPAFGGGMGHSGPLHKPVPEQSVDGGGGGGPGVGVPNDVSNLRTANPYVIMPPHSNYSDAEGPPEVRTHTHARTHARIHIYSHTHARAHTRMHTHLRPHIRTHARTHTHVLSLSHTHTHTHTHTACDCYSLD